MSRKSRLRNEKKRGYIPSLKQDTVHLKFESDFKPEDDHEMIFITKKDNLRIKLIFGRDYPFKPPVVWINEIPFRHFMYTYRRKDITNIHMGLLHGGWLPGISIPDILMYVLDKVVC